MGAAAIGAVLIPQREQESPPPPESPSRAVAAAATLTERRTRCGVTSFIRTWSTSRPSCRSTGPSDQ